MINRPALSVGDIPIAPRKERGAVREQSQDRSAALSKDVAVPATDVELAQRSRTQLPRRSPDERKEAVSKRALVQEQARTRLRDLKRAQARESKHFVNVPLDYETKMRLQKAALENDLKMTVIMKAAIDQYLRDNGY
ncbi:MAG: hypothetical protein EOR72_25770 [Mesorhizobium sp.]|uniref:hypothetical protein n=1 Tax=Mesorhizobium sp. TaxID=1871066 RepID=UPI000FE9167A|nr:hypothetical protein [Mesorhizobium sp.]RWM09732.1 MAG: hypothetical protein EOR72_25770 [Mesorhizobium sp.]